MTPIKLNAAIIIVSTTASKDPSSDVSGNLLTESFTANSTAESTTWQVVARRIVSDDREEIQGALTTLLEGPNKLNLIVTTGGTGFAITDITPEVSNSISALLQILIIETGSETVLAERGSRTGVRLIPLRWSGNRSKKRL